MTGSGEIIESNLSFIFMKYGYDVSQTTEEGTSIHLGNVGTRTLNLVCTITEFTDSEVIIVPYRLEDRGRTETTVTQLSESDAKEEVMGDEEPLRKSDKLSTVASRIFNTDRENLPVIDESGQLFGNLNCHSALKILLE